MLASCDEDVRKFTLHILRDFKCINYKLLLSMSVAFRAVSCYTIVARCAPAAATVQVLGVNLLLTPTCHASWSP
jgi:hypothetical protein